MYTEAHVDRRTRRITVLSMGAQSFEEECILGHFTNAIMAGKVTRITLSQDDEMVLEFKLVDPSLAVEEQDSDG